MSEERAEYKWDEECEGKVGREVFREEDIRENTKVGIFGSRTLKDERIKILILEAIKKYKPSCIVTAQEAGGVSEVAQRIAKEKAIPLTVHFLNFRYLRGAFEKRGKFILENSDWILIIHDGKSKGTYNEWQMTKKHKKPFIYVNIPVIKNGRDVGWNIEDEWERDLTNIPSDNFELDLEEEI